MMHRPWDCAQPDEWLPQSLRLCWGDGGGDGGGGWGDSGGDSGGGGWGDSGGGYGGATTGGGDWGSSGSYDASGFNAATNDAYAAALAASPGGFYDTGGPGIAEGALGAEFGGAFGLSGISGQPGTNAFGAELDAGGGNTSGVGNAIASWGQSTAAGGPGAGTNVAGLLSGGMFGDYGGGGGGYGGGGYSGGGFGTGFGTGYGGGGGGSYTGGGYGGGAFGSGTLGASNAVSSVTGSGMTDTSGAGSLAGPAGQASSGAPTTSEAQSESAGGGETTSDSDAAPSEEGGDTSVAPSEASFGEPAASEAAPEAQTEAAPEVSSTGGQQATPAAQSTADRGETEAAPSAFGPQSLALSDPSQADQEASQQHSDLTQSALAPQDVNWGAVFEAPNQDVNWGSVFEAPAQDPADRGVWGDLPGVYSQGISNLWSDIGSSKAAQVAQDFINSHALNDPATWLSPTNQQTFNELANIPGQIANIPSALNAWVNEQSWGPAAFAFDQQALGEQGKGQTDLASQLGIENVGDTQGIDPGSEQYGTEAYAPGGIEPSAEQTGVTGEQDLASQLGIGDIDLTDWASVFEAPELAPDWASVFEGTPSSPDWTSVFEGAPSVDPSTTAPSVDVTMESGPAGQQTSTDDTSTPGGDPGLSGLSVDAATAAAAAAAAAGAPGAPGTPGTAPATAPAQGGQTFVSEAAVGNVTNAVSNAALNVDAPMAAVDAVSVAAYNAMQSLANPTEVGEAVSAAALANGATQQQADAMAAAATAAAQSQTAFSPGVPGQQQQAPTAPEQPGAPTGPEAPSTTSAIAGGRATDFNYPSSQTQAPSLIDMAQPSTQAGIPGGRGTDFNYPTTSTMPLGQPGGIGSDIVASPNDDDHDTPEPPDTSPPQDPNAPRPPGNIPGQLIGARDNYPNSQLDNPRNPFYQNSGRTDYRQGRPGVDYRTARQAGVVPNFHVGDYNVQDLDARLVENINRAIVAMERAGIPNTLTVSSAYRPSTRAEAAERGMDPRTSQESVYARGNAPGGRHFAAARPGGSNHAPGRAIDFNPELSGRALTWLRANAREYGLETLGSRGGRPYDVPHIQLQGGGRGNAGARPSAQEQAEQRAIDAQNRQLAQERGQARTQQAAAPPGGWRGIGSDRSDIAWTAQPDVAPADIPPAALPPPDVPLAPDRPPADIPAPVAPLPAPFMTPPARGRADPALLARTATQIAKDMAEKGPRPTSLAEGTAAAVALARSLAQAGIPVNIATQIVTNVVREGTRQAGYDPDGMLASSSVKGVIAAALQGYAPAKPGEAQGPQGFQPDAPVAPGKQSAAPFGQQFAGLSQSLGSVAPSGMTGRRGEIGSQQPMFSIPGLDRLSPIIAPLAPPALPINPREQASLFDTRFLAKGGHVAKDEPVVVGEEGPETFVPDQPGTVFPHQPQPGKGTNVDRWPKIPAPEYPGRYGGVEREMNRQTRAAQNPLLSLIDLIDSERLPLNAANWHAMLNDPALIALGRSRMDDRREGIDPGAEQYGTEQPGPVLPVGTYIPTPAPAAAPPDPNSPMVQALGYGSIRRPMRIGRQSYSQ